MLPLAELIMRGRGQALAFVLITLATSPILWPNTIFAAAAISLVWLRVGVKDGILLWLWSLLPASALAYYLDNELPLLLVSSISLTSWVLRTTFSWSYTLMTLTLCGVLSALVLNAFASESFQVYIRIYEQFLTELKESVNDPELASMLPATLENTFIAGLYGTMLVISGFVSQALARSWQARLYNPGGFQQEFHRLRLGKAETIILVLLAILFTQLDKQYLTWVWIAFFPFLVSGIALCHAIAKRRKMAIHWYVVFYFVLLFWGPLKVLLTVLAIVDSVIDIRKKLPEADNTQDKR